MKENAWEKLTEEHQIEKLNFYCKDNMKELRKICDHLIGKYNLNSNMYDEDLYSVAIDTLVESIVNYNKEKSKFKTFFTGNLQRKFSTWMRDNARGCRCNVQRDSNGKIIKDEKGNNIMIQNASFDIPNDDGLDLKEIVASDFDVEESILRDDDINSGQAGKYIDSLGEIQREIAQYLYDGYCSAEIKEMLNLKDKEYQEILNDMKSYDKKRILFEDLETENIVEEIEEENKKMGTFEKGKDTSYSLESISKQLRKKRIRDNHILQRHSGQWDNITKSELISDILQGNSLTQVIISEEVKGDIRMKWLIDGKQRCTNIDDYFHDGFAISQKVTIGDIEYQGDKLDENGNVLYNEDGFPIPENKVFNIRGKKFSQLPEELQDKFKEYQLPVMLNLNCSKEKIAYDIARFNRCRPMNKAQNGWLGLDEEFAELIQNILKMDFFKPDCRKSKYTTSNVTSGALRRMLVETIMISEFMDDYISNFGKICEYLSENANQGMFIDLYIKMDRLNSLLGEETAELFNVKNSFLFFTLFNKFDKLNLDDEKFNDFLCAFQSGLHSKEINGESFDSLEEIRNTKDKTTVIKKLNYLESLMREYLGVTEEVEECSEQEDTYEEIEIDEEDDDVENDIEEVENIKDFPQQTSLEFVKDNIYENITDDDISYYEEDLDILTLDVDNESSLLEPENHNSLVGIVAYSYKKDERLDEWFVDFFSRHNTYIKNQKENYTYMVNDFEKYLRRNAA